MTFAGDLLYILGVLIKLRDMRHWLYSFNKLKREGHFIKDLRNFSIIFVS